MDNQLTVWKIREIIAESGKMRINDVMNYFKARYSGQYDSKIVRSEAKEMIQEAKRYM
jgi:hypothetical protein